MHARETTTTHLYFERNIIAIQVDVWGHFQYLLTAVKSLDYPELIMALQQS